MRFLFALFVVPFFLAACTDADGDAEYVDAMAREHAGDTPVAAPIAASATYPDVVTSRPVYARTNGTDVVGFLARPSDTAIESPPGLIVIHEWWGLNDNIQAMTERLADEGYVALAVDLYGGEMASTSDEAQALMQQAMGRKPMLTENLEAAYRYLQEEQGVGNVGTIGWCFGGGWSLQAALAMPKQIDATVIYYGQLVTDRDRLAALDMPILGLFGEEDGGIPVSGVRTFEETLQSLGKNAEIVVYPGAGHAFANPSGERYVAEAAEDAWAKTLAFLDTNLRDSAAPADSTSG